MLALTVEPVLSSCDQRIVFYFFYRCFFSQVFLQKREKEPKTMVGNSVNLCSSFYLFLTDGIIPSPSLIAQMPISFSSILSFSYSNNSCAQLEDLTWLFGTRVDLCTSRDKSKITPQGNRKTGGGSVSFSILSWRLLLATIRIKLKVQRCICSS